MIGTTKPTGIILGISLSAILGVGSMPGGTIHSIMQTPPPPHGLTAVGGIKVGHHTLTARPTGCTVVVAEKGAVGGVDVRGSAPGTRETDLLDPVNTVQQVHAIVLTGGSAYGLATASGVMKYLEERQIGFPIGGGVVPIVPAAVIFDLGIGDFKVRPDDACGYAAAKSAKTSPVEEGNVGAGAGATVGKMAGRGRAMKGGLGSAHIALQDGTVVAALVVVNAVGDVIDPSTGRTVAGARTADGSGLVDVRTILRGLPDPPAAQSIENTTIGVVATNARLTKAQAKKFAQMAHDGMARAIVPAHTSMDGDTIFSLATGTHEGNANIDRIGALGAEAMSMAIVRAVRTAKGIPGFPAASDLR
jgi:L-aminopeptidase/D-esterase-like protein